MSSYPFPQLWLGSENFYLDVDRVARMTPDFWLDGNNVLSCEAGSSWHVADFGGCYVFANGVSTLVYTPANGLQHFHGSQSEPVLFGTCCNFNGQLFVGNIFPAPAEGEGEEDEVQFTGTWADANADCVGWSRIGSIELALDKSNVSGFMSMGIGGVVQRVLQLG